MFLLQDDHHQLFVELQQPRALTLDGAYDVLGSLDTSVMPPVFRMATATPCNRSFSTSRTPTAKTLGRAE